MALTESEKLDIAMILNVTYIDVNDKITNLGSTYITAEVEAKVREQLDRWLAKGAKFTKTLPNDKNFGSDRDPEREKTDIKKRLAGLLYFTEIKFGGGNWGYSARA